MQTSLAAAARNLVDDDSSRPRFAQRINSNYSFIADTRANAEKFWPTIYINFASSNLGRDTPPNRTIKWVTNFHADAYTRIFSNLSIIIRAPSRRFRD